APRWFMPVTTCGLTSNVLSTWPPETRITGTSFMRTSRSRPLVVTEISKTGVPVLPSAVCPALIVASIPHLARLLDRVGVVGDHGGIVLGSPRVGLGRAPRWVMLGALLPCLACGDDLPPPISPTSTGSTGDEPSSTDPLPADTTDASGTADETAADPFCGDGIVDEG